MSDVHDTVSEQLRRTRQRYTAGRRQLVDALHHAEHPVTILELRGLGVEQSQSSLYRNLAVLEQCGSVRRVATPDDTPRYELAEALSEHHHHLVCAVCGTVEDITLPPELEAALDTAGKQAARRRRFEIEAHRFDLVGTCGSCS